MGIATAIAVGAGLSYLGAKSQADAVRSASGDAMSAADGWRQYVAGQQKSALSEIATPSQMAAYDKALSSQEATVQRQEALVKAIDPALIEAGKQAKQLLEGQDAQVLGPMKAQRQSQRQDLIDALRTQLGPGAETSSAGRAALQRFDTETNSQLNTAQQGYLNSLLQTSLSGRPDMAKENSTLASIMQASPELAKANAILGFTQAAAGPNAAAVGAAGGAGAARQIQGQMISNLGSSIISGGAAYYGAQRTSAAPAPTLSEVTTMPTLTMPQLGASSGYGVASTGAGTYSYRPGG